jgi:hypothetical protein
MELRRDAVALAPRRGAEASPGSRRPLHLRTVRRLPGDGPAPRLPSGGVPSPSRTTEPAEPRERIRRLVDRSARHGDPESALRALIQLRGEIDDLVRVQIERGLASGLSFGDLGRALGISRQAAHRRFRELAPDFKRPVRRRLRATEQARRALRVARAETHASGVEAPGSAQLLLGVLQTDSDAAHALRAEGITVERARRFARAGGGDPMCVRRILHDAVGRAGGRRVKAEHLLLAALDDPKCGASRLLEALGISPDSIRARFDD